MTKRIKSLLMALSIVFSSSSVWAGDFEDGMVAYEKKDFGTAFKKFNMAASQHKSKAQFYVGYMYDSGQGVVQDYAEAARWYRLAAAQGDSDAQWYLGNMYFSGQGILQNYTMAHKWFNLSAINGDSDAIQLRNAVAAKMTPQQIAEAQKLARECQARNFKNCD